MRARSGIAAGLPQTNKNGPVTRKGKLGQKKKFQEGNARTRNVKARTTKEEEEEE